MCKFEINISRSFEIETLNLWTQIKIFFHPKHIQNIYINKNDEGCKWRNVNFSDTIHERGLVLFVKIHLINDHLFYKYLVRQFSYKRHKCKNTIIFERFCEFLSHYAFFFSFCALYFKLSVLYIFLRLSKSFATFGCCHIFSYFYDPKILFELAYLYMFCIYLQKRNFKHFFYYVVI